MGERKRVNKRDSLNKEIPTAYVTTVRERKQELLRQIEKLKKSNYSGDVLNSSELSAFISQNNVRGFNSEILERLFGEHARCFRTEEDVEVGILEYIQLCDEHAILPSLSGISCYFGLSYEALRIVLNTPTRIGFVSLNRFKEYLKQLMENAGANGKINNNFFNIYMSFYFGVQQQQQINVSNTLTMQANTTDTLNLIKNQIALENKDKENDS